MRFSELISVLKPQEVSGDTSVDIKHVWSDSRRVSQGDVFVAIKGFETDGHRFIEGAKARGCQAFVTEHPVDVGDSALAVVSDSRSVVPLLTHTLHGHIFDALKMVGITGTNGKTTTAYLVFDILRHLGWSPGLISTVETVSGEQIEKAIRTTPESPELYRHFGRTADAGGKAVVMEVSSHALSLNRVDLIPYNVAVFTNLSHDHLDFHKTTEAYLRAKKRLFDLLSDTSAAVVNFDDPLAQAILADCKARCISYSSARRDVDISLLRQYAEGEQRKLDVSILGEKVTITNHLIGRFNIYNILAAAAAAHALGIAADQIASGLSQPHFVPGRCERFRAAAGFEVIVDYAHTPDALARLGEAVRHDCENRLIMVTGSGGDRDRGKRPLMAKAVADHADYLVLTCDNPRTEDPAQIMADMIAGIPDDFLWQQENDRRSAIELAINSAEPGDIVVVAGKGHEDYQEIGGQRLPFDDRVVVREILGKNLIS